MHYDTTEDGEACKIICSQHPTKKKRLVVTIDDQTWREVDFFFFDNHKKTLEKCRSVKELEEIFGTLEFQQARLYALRRITKQALPKKSLARSLSLRAVTPETIQKVIEDFEGRGYLNDQEWTRSFVRSQLARKVGPRSIAQKLAFKGIDKEQVAAALQQEDGCGQENAIATLLSTKYRQRNLTDYKERGKVIGALMRRGFDLDEILKACKKVGASMDED
jgi:regulatory protein